MQIPGTAERVQAFQQGDGAAGADGEGLHWPDQRPDRPQPSGLREVAGGAD